MDVHHVNDDKILATAAIKRRVTAVNVFVFLCSSQTEESCPFFQCS